MNENLFPNLQAALYGQPSASDDGLKVVLWIIGVSVVLALLAAAVWKVRLEKWWRNRTSRLTVPGERPPFPPAPARNGAVSSTSTTTKPTRRTSGRTKIPIVPAPAAIVLMPEVKELGLVKVTWISKPTAKLFPKKPLSPSYQALAWVMESANWFTSSSKALSLKVRSDGSLHRSLPSGSEKIHMRLRFEPTAKIVARFLAIRKVKKSEESVGDVIYALRLSTEEPLNVIPVLRKDGKEWIPDELRFNWDRLRGDVITLASLEDEYEAACEKARNSVLN